LPDELGGLTRDSISPASSSVAVYGTGVTVAGGDPPCFGRTGAQIRDQLTNAVGSAKTGPPASRPSIGAVKPVCLSPTGPP